MKLLALIASVVMSSFGCAHKPSFENQPAYKVFTADYEEIWRACQKALVQYPIKVNNSESGVLETDYIKGAKAFKAPDASDNHSSGYRYRVLIRVVKGATKRQEAVKVKITKEVEIQRDFFTAPEPLTSDGLEERMLMYRIERELQVDRVIKKLEKRSASTTTSSEKHVL